MSLKSLTQILTEKNLKNFKLFNNNYLVKNNSTILPLIDRNYSLLKTFIKGKSKTVNLLPTVDSDCTNFHKQSF